MNAALVYDDLCPACNDAILRVQRTGGATRCDGCGEVYLPTSSSAAPTVPAALPPAPRAPVTGRDSLADRLITLLRALGHTKQFARDTDPRATVPRSMRGGNPLASMIARASNATDDATDRDVQLLWRRCTVAQGKTGAEARALVLAALAATPLPGDPADTYDPDTAREAHARYQSAPDDVYAVLRVLRSIAVPYTPWEAVCAIVAESCAPEDVRAGWAQPEAPRGPGRPAVDRARPSADVQRRAWGEHLVGQALAWWFDADRVTVVP